MQAGKVNTILRAYKKGIPLDHRVDINAKTTYAVEQMVTNNIESIAVIEKGKPIGMVYLDDALKQLGLEIHKTGT